MLTYQDLLSVSENETKKYDFIMQAINEHKYSDMCKIALDAQNYYRQQNTTIVNYQKMLYTVTGKSVPDNYTANHKCVSNYFQYFLTQLNQYQLGNGIYFTEDKTKDKLGGKDFDYKIQMLGEYALRDGVSFGFFNVDHIEVFELITPDRGFVPLWNEETGALSAGIRYWQIASDKPLRITLFEIDGYTDYIKRIGESVEIVNSKRRYSGTVLKNSVDDMEIVDGENADTFPIVPMWGNSNHQSELVGMKSNIDAFDLIKSGFANDLDDASMIYWTLENCGGMDDIDLVKFIERMKTVKAAVVDGSDGARAEAHTMDIPYQSRETYLRMLREDLFRDFMALDVSQIAAGNVTATQIKAAYEPLNNKADKFEYQVAQCINGLLEVAGIDDTPTFKRSQIVNQSEETDMILSAASYLDDETILKKLPFLTVDEVNEILERKATEEMNRFNATENTEEETMGDENTIPEQEPQETEEV